MSSIASYIRSDYPVIILGRLEINGKYIGDHAVCAVGFRESPFNPGVSPTTAITLADSASKMLYIHDDNIGPNARFRIKIQENNGINYPVLHLEAPDYSQFKETNNYQITPTTLVVATHNELRASPDQLYDVGLRNVASPLDHIFKNSEVSIQLSLSTRFIKLTDYIHNELNRLLKENPETLSRLRLDLWEKVRPMSLHLGLVRIGLAESSMPLLDVLYDTTDSNLQMFDYIHFSEIIDKIVKDFQLDFNKPV